MNIGAPPDPFWPFLALALRQQRLYKTHHMSWKAGQLRTDLWSGEGGNFRRWLTGHRRRSGLRSLLIWISALVGLTAAGAYHQDPRVFDRTIRQWTVSATGIVAFPHSTR